jgi:hypothetical protein
VQRDDLLHQEFTFRPRNENLWTDREIQGPEFLNACDVLYGFSVESSSDQFAVCRNLPFVKGLIEIEVEFYSVDFQLKGQKDFRTQARTVNAFFPQIVAGDLQEVFYRP